ncbi:hypothetical protein B5X24_HaOG214006 [Helicoverpa armigera]|nr:hypothetical protein B5X24_HaOG214006 [Helicoverpa armigera]
MCCGGGAAPERCRCVVLHRNIYGMSHDALRRRTVLATTKTRRGGVNALRRRSGTAQLFCVTRKDNRMSNATAPQRHNNVNGAAPHRVPPLSHYIRIRTNPSPARQLLMSTWLQ